MKKIALVVALATSAAMAAPFNGFSVGGSLGAAFTKYKVGGIVNKSQSKTNLLVNLFTGYTKSFDNVIAGADVALNVEKISNISVTNSVGAYFMIKNETSLGISISPRVGYKFDETTAGYFKLGLGYSKINLSKESKDLGFKPGMFSVTPAFGVEKFFSENVSVRGEVGYKFEKMSTKDGSAAKILCKDIKKNAVVATVGVSYSF